LWANVILHTICPTLPFERAAELSGRRIELSPVGTMNCSVQNNSLSRQAADDPAIVRPLDAPDIRRQVRFDPGLMGMSSGRVKFFNTDRGYGFMSSSRPMAAAPTSVRARAREVHRSFLTISPPSLLAPSLDACPRCRGRRHENTGSYWSHTRNCPAPGSSPPQSDTRLAATNWSGFAAYRMV
jgi:hypothetical protein